MESIASKLINNFATLLGRAADALPEQLALLPSVIQQSFPGKLLPFCLLSVSSLPNVRNEMGTVFREFWPTLEGLLERMHQLLTSLRIVYPTMALDEETTNTSLLRGPPRFNAFSLHVQEDTTEVLVHISDELQTALGLESARSLALNDVTAALWRRIVSSDAFRAKRIRTHPSVRAELFRVSIPSDLAKLLCTSSLLVAVNTPDIQDAQALRKATDLSVLSFTPSRVTLSQHMWLVRSAAASPQPEPPSSTDVSAVTPPPAPIDARASSGHVVGTQHPFVEEGIAWLQDQQRMLSWIGSHYASTLIIGDSAGDGDIVPDVRWMSSPLFRGGLQGDVGTSSGVGDVQDGRNELLLQQIVAYAGAGKKLVDKVKHALDPSTGTGAAANPKLLMTRLKRQDSVEAALEKSGSIEAVDRAVRVAFAVLLKHTNAAYVNDALTKEGVPSESVVDAWRSALLLRRWYAFCCLVSRHHRLTQAI
ncbi:hypothetical protein PINS_up000192 [Pythium insidiosum]|nr:hypothetical protein PINS_up000192 [Pythium insidiosum]